MNEENSNVEKYKNEILKLQLEIENEKENRFTYSLKGDQASLNQSIEREGGLNTKIRELEDKIFELEAPRLRNDAEVRNIEREKYSLPNLVNKKTRIDSLDFKENYAIIIDYLKNGYSDLKSSKFAKKLLLRQLRLANLHYLNWLQKKVLI